MRLVRRALRSRVTAERALRLLDARAHALGLPPPAALCGDWFGSRAVLAPSAGVTPLDPADPFAGLTDRVRVRDAVPGAVGGGWIGYLGYDLSDPAGRRAALPPVAGGWVDSVLRLDHDHHWWFEALVPDGDPSPTGLADELTALLDKGDVTGYPAWTATRLRRPPAADHQSAVRRCVEAIGEGELYQANVCTRFHAPFTGDPAAVFAEGVRRLAPRRAAYVAGDWGAVASLSPELFLARKGTSIISSPIKGTLPRRGPADDGLAAALRASTKDVAENVMITDLVRNDLGRVCTVGSVTVPRLLEVVPAPGVWHLASTVSGRLAEATSDADVLRATFPPGSVTGAPKTRALELITEVEPAARGVYTGAVGMASPIAGTEFNVAIRTLEFHGEMVELGVGGGITASSDPAAEWQECLHKAAPLAELLAAPPD